MHIQKNPTCNMCVAKLDVTTKESIPSQLRTRCSNKDRRPCNNLELNLEFGRETEEEENKRFEPLTARSHFGAFHDHTTSINLKFDTWATILFVRCRSFEEGPSNNDRVPACVGPERHFGIGSPLTRTAVTRYGIISN